MDKFQGFYLDALTRRVKPTTEDIENLKNWVVVRASVKGYPWHQLTHYAKASVASSVLDSLKKSGCDWRVAYSSAVDDLEEIENTVWRAVFDALRGVLLFGTVGREHVRDSLEDFVYANIGTWFSQVKKWKYVKYTVGEYPYRPAVQLWKRKLIASFDCVTWRLHSGRTANIVYEIDDELLKMR